jgi:outer membrane immunogenic protein
MRNHLLAGVALAVLAGGSVALAADLGTPIYKAPIYKAPPVFSWTGCYVGADVGGAWDRQHTSTTTTALQAPANGDISGSSVIGGPYVGCNYQFAPAWVVGLEGDVSWAKLGGTTSAANLFPNGTPAGFGGISWNSSTDWLASARGRLGYAIVPNVLVYGTGGAAWTRTNYSGSDVIIGGASSASFTDTRTGWVAGAGVDWAPWNNNWIFRVEYLHYQFGGVSSTATVFPNFGNTTTFTFGDLKIDTVRAGLSYKF